MSEKPAYDDLVSALYEILEITEDELRTSISALLKIREICKKLLPE